MEWKSFRGFIYDKWKMVNCDVHCEQQMGRFNKKVSNLIHTGTGRKYVPV